MAPATLIYYFKDYVQKGRYVLEQKIYKVDNLKQFPDGIKYRMTMVDMETGKRVLMDNHHPKSHHVHVGNTELEYHFENEKKLIEDFKKFVFQYMGVKI